MPPTKKTTNEDVILDKFYCIVSYCCTTHCGAHVYQTDRECARALKGMGTFKNRLAAQCCRPHHFANATLSHCQLLWLLCGNHCISPRGMLGYSLHQAFYSMRTGIISVVIWPCMIAYHYKKINISIIEYWKLCVLSPPHPSAVPFPLLSLGVGVCHHWGWQAHGAGGCGGQVREVTETMQVLCRVECMLTPHHHLLKC